MPLKWLSLPYVVAKAISFALFLAAVILTIWDMTTLYSQFDSHCIAGWEITDKVGSNLILNSITLVPDLVFLACITAAIFIKTCNFGSDPGAIAYNLIVGILQLCSMTYIYAIEDCGNDAIPIVKSVALFSLLAGILHLINAVFSLVFLASEERTFPIRRPTSSTLAEN
ncbi:uncharacterized protein [Musca autumnalis]|uniref:uncharacterized protein n=1 Tax=Musca autumnalis TaxID=221902 RepID=UPI003CEF2F06